MPYRVIQISKLMRLTTSVFESCFIPIGEEYLQKHQARAFAQECIDKSNGEEFIIIKTYRTYKFEFSEPD